MYKLVVGCRILRYRTRTAQWASIRTTREVTYTEKELGMEFTSPEGYVYYTIRIPTTDGFDRIRVFKSLLIPVETPNTILK